MEVVGVDVALELHDALEGGPEVHRGVGLHVGEEERKFGVRTGEIDHFFVALDCVQVCVSELVVKGPLAVQAVPCRGDSAVFRDTNVPNEFENPIANKYVNPSLNKNHAVQASVSPLPRAARTRCSSRTEIPSRR